MYDTISLNATSRVKLRFLSIARYKGLGQSEKYEGRWICIPDDR